MVLDKQNSNTPHRTIMRGSSTIAKSSLADETAPRKPSEYWFAILATIALIVVAEWSIGGKFGLGTATESSTEPLPILSPIQTTTESSDGLLKMLADTLSSHLSENTVEQASSDLLLRASEAVSAEDHALFADSMRLLGMNALREQDIDAAKVYLDEALSVFEELEDELGIASVEMLRGEISLKRRQQARRAAYAYDVLQLARWKVAQGQFHDAVESLESVVSENLALNRYGAAAAAYQTLYKGYIRHGQLYEAQQAGIEIVKLHSSSGRALQAQAMLHALQRDGLDEQSVLQLSQTSIGLQQEYEESVAQMGQARDYQQLYNHFIHAGDPVRAWQFRLKSQQSLRGVSLRAMHRQQTGVLALLYTSNDHMKNARSSLDRAVRLFSNHDKAELSDVSAQMRAKIY